MADYRNVFVLIAAVGLLQLAGGILGVITPLGLEGLGLGPLSIGLIAACHAAGFMAGAASAPRALTLFGNIRVFSAAAAMTAAGALAMTLAPDPAGWTLIRIVQGAGFALMFASAESWLSEAVPAGKRGGVTGFYHVVAKAALLIGPFFAAGHAALDPRTFIWCGLFLALALMPICLTRRGQPAPPDAAPLPFKRLFELAPAAVIAAFLAGMVNSGTLALLPVFAVSAAPDADTATGAAATAMAAAWLGGLISQWPAGRLSDRFDRRLIVAVMAVASALAAGAAGLLADVLPYSALLVLLAVWGAGSLSFYGVAVAHGVDRAPPGQIARVMSSLLFVWAGGSVLGPLLSGLAMRSAIGPGGLFLLAAGLLVVLAGAMLFRRTQRDEPTPLEQEPWEITQPTSVSGAGFDPRSEESGGPEDPLAQV